MSRVVALLWIVLCGMLAYYSLVKPDIALSIIVGAVMLFVWLFEVHRGKRTTKTL